MINMSSPVTTAAEFKAFLLEQTKNQLRSNLDILKYINCSSNSLHHVLVVRDLYQHIAIDYYCDLVDAIGQDFGVASECKLNKTEIEIETTENAITEIYNEIRG